MNKRYNNVEMLKANIERIHTAPYYAQMARNLMAQIRKDEHADLKEAYPDSLYKSTPVYN